MSSGVERLLWSGLPSSFFVRNTRVAAIVLDVSNETEDGLMEWKRGVSGHIWKWQKGGKGTNRTSVVCIGGLVGGTAGGITRMRRKGQKWKGTMTYNTYDR